MKKLTHVTVSLALPLICSYFATTAEAATAISNFGVTASVVSRCSIKTPSFSFRNDNKTSTNASDAMVNISPDCTSNTDYVVAVTTGRGRDAPATSHNLAGTNAGRLTDGIHTDAAYDWAIGEASGRTGRAAASGSRIANPVTLYGRVPNAQHLTAESLAESVLVTLSF